jgi:hypothetical protein
MTAPVNTQLDGTTLIVRIPMRFQRRGGRKRIVAPDGSEIAPTSRPQPDGTLVKALARSWRWQRMLDSGVYASVTEISEAEAIGKSYVSRILRLALLAPDIVEAILAGRTDQGMMLEQLERAAAAGRRGRRRQDRGRQGAGAHARPAADPPSGRIAAGLFPADRGRDAGVGDGLHRDTLAAPPQHEVQKRPSLRARITTAKGNNLPPR